jgi:hypothetical protein
VRPKSEEGVDFIKKVPATGNSGLDLVFSNGSSGLLKNRNQVVRQGAQRESIP